MLLILKQAGKRYVDMKETLLEIKHLQTYFYIKSEPVKAVDDVSFEIREGQTVCLIGESGCGKSTSGLSIMRLVPVPAGRIVSGEIWFQGRDLMKLPEKEMRLLRGNEISMVFQEPLTSLNPVFPVGEQIAEAIMLHKKLSKSEARLGAIKMMELVQIPNPPLVSKSFPHELSGGMRQRIMMAMALSCYPKLLIADEPTTALDVTIQAQILDLLRDMKKKFGMSILLITHDLGVAAEMADYVAVMYQGKIVEQGPVNEIYHRPIHPYTKVLLRAVKRGGENQ